MRGTRDLGDGITEPIAVPIDTIERLAPGDTQWTTIATLQTPRYGHTAALYGDRLVLLGGRGAGGASVGVEVVAIP